MGDSNRSALPLYEMSVKDIATEINNAGYAVEASIDTGYVTVCLRPMRNGGALYPEFSYSGEIGPFGDRAKRYHTVLAYVAGLLFEFQEREGIV